MERVFLVGYMGAGKTTVGKALSKKMGLTFIDLDLYIERRYRKSVGQLFAENGESAFRDIEQRMLQEVSAFENVLISTGGGTPCFFDNMDKMNSAGITIYLKVSVEELAKRLDVCRSVRPVLQNRKGTELRAFIKDCLIIREPFYSKATIIYDAEHMWDDKDLEVICTDLMALLKKNES